MNLAHLIDDHPADAPALLSRGRVTTYGDLREQSGRLAGGLRGLGLAEGDHVAIVCGNNWYFVAAYLAVLRAGMVAVPLNPLSPGPEQTVRLAAAEVKAVIAGPRGARSLADVDRSQTPGLELAVVAGGEGSGVAGAVELDDVLTAEPVATADRSEDDLAVLLFTSGTAGAPRAAMLTHGNLLASIELSDAHRRRDGSAQPPAGPDDVLFGVLPMFHIFGLNGVLGTALHAGARVVLDERFDALTALATIAEHGITILAGAPPMWAAFANLPDAPSDAFASVRYALSGAAALPRRTFDTMLERFGLTVGEGYGLTETSPAVTSDDGPEVVPGSIGRPVPGVEVRLVDADGFDALVGDVGEIWVRGPNVFAGYYRDEVATGTVLDDEGWLHTGDLAVADDDGRLSLVDRSKDLIIVSGFNVHPSEVEDVLYEHPAVSQVVVVGHPHPSTGETVIAHVVLATGQVAEEDDIIDFCADRLARYKAPTRVVFTEELPIGVAGKIRRRDLVPEL